MDNVNKGVLFKNNDKKTDKHPDYNGSININGTEHFLSAWLNTSKKGAKYLSVSIGKVKEQPRVQQQAQQPPQQPKDDFIDDDILF